VRGLLSLPIMPHVRILLVDDKGDDPTNRGFGQRVAAYPPARTSRWARRFWGG
jgi:hypothetical protein